MKLVCIRVLSEKKNSTLSFEVRGWKSKGYHFFGALLNVGIQVPLSFDINVHSTYYTLSTSSKLFFKIFKLLGFKLLAYEASAIIMGKLGEEEE